MHPPFFPVDHKVNPTITHHRPARTVTRRSAPAVLQLGLPATGFSLAPLRPGPETPITLPGGKVIMARPHLALVPPPDHTWRDRLGRFLIRQGQRMILQNRPG